MGLYLTKREEYSYLLERSRRFYQTALMQIERGFLDLAAFSLEQSLQLFLKACLLKLGVDYPRTHSIRKLIDIIYEVTEARQIKELLDKYSVELALLEDAYITSRYVPRDYRIEEVTRVKKAVDSVFELVGKIVSKECKT